MSMNDDSSRATQEPSRFGALFGSSIGARIRQGFAVVLLLHISIAVMGHIGLQSATENLRDYESVVEETEAILEIDRLVEDLHHIASTYKHTGFTSAEKRARRVHERLSAALANASQREHSEETAELFGSMEERLSEYMEQFDKVVVDRVRRDQVVQDRLLPLGRELLTYAESEPSWNASQRAAFVSSIANAERAALGYLQSPNAENIRDFESSVRDASSQNTASNERLGGLLHEYESAFVEVYQLTRGYLHLTNVVMSGQASEFLWASGALRERSLASSQTLARETESNIVSFQTLSNVVSFITIVLGVIASWAIVRSVTGPIMSIASTFREIAGGRHDLSIPGLERADEIGRMASAAEVFKDKSIETEALLHETQRLAADLEVKNDELESFVYSASHDLKSPLVSLIGYLGYLRQDIEAEQYGKSDHYLGRIEDATQRIKRNIEDLLQLSRIGRVPLDRSSFGFGEIVETVLADNRDRVAERQAEVRVSGEDVPITADRDRLTDLLSNLVSNALKYGCDEQARSIRISADQDPSGVTLSVSDEGSGIDPQDHERVFGMFERLTTSQEGSGLGLSIVRKIAESHGGRVWVDSSPGDGATFRVWLPSSPAVPEDSDDDDLRSPHQRPAQNRASAAY